MLKDILYGLKNEYGSFCAFYRTVQNTVNLTTGRATIDYQVDMIAKAIVMPVHIARRYSPQSLFKVSAVIPTLSAYDVMDRVVILEGPVHEFEQDDYAIVNRVKYQIEKLDSDPIGTFYYLKALKGMSPYTTAVQNMLKLGFNGTDRTLIALDEYVRTLGNLDLLEGFHWLACGDDPEYDILDVGDFDLTATYRELGLRGGFKLPQAKFIVPAYDLQDIGIGYACLGDCDLTSTDICIGKRTFRFGTYTWTPDTDLVGSIFLTVKAGVINLYKGGALIHSAFDNTVTGNNGTEYTWTGTGYLRGVYIGSTQTIAKIDTGIRLFNGRLGRDGY